MSQFFAQLDNRSLCLFVEKLPHGSNRALGGGCFFMRRDLILTAKHVVEDAVAQQRPIFVANGSENGKLLAARPRHLYAHPEIDIALVQVSTDDLHIDHPLYPSHFPLHVETGAVGVGYDRHASDNSANTWVFGVHRIDKFESQKRERYHGSIEYALHFEAPWMESGCSGGPVITSGGGVAAVLIQDFTTASDTSQEDVPKAFGRATSVYPIVDTFRSPFEYPPSTRP